MSTSEQPKVRHQTVMDDETRHVSRVYADALYRAAEASGQVEEVLGELESLVNDVFGADPGLEVFLTSAAVGRERKEAVLQKAFGDRATPTFSHFLLVLNRHDRLDMLRGIAEGFRTLYNRKTRKLEVNVRSAVPLTDDERQRLCDDIRSMDIKGIGHVEPILRETVDPHLLGGMVVRILDWVYDATIRTRLQMIRNELIERSSHGIQSGRDRFGD